MQVNEHSGTLYAPRAFINVVDAAERSIIFFNEQFNAVGFQTSMVGKIDRFKDHYNDASMQNIIAPKNGYAYVFTSNDMEPRLPWAWRNAQMPKSNKKIYLQSDALVYFDNLQVTHTRSPILEESHFYPFGMKIAAISSSAAGLLENKYHYNGKEDQCKEFADGSGLDWVDYGARMYDAQIGRWHTVDPKAAKGPQYSPYSVNFNNPILYYDPNGEWPVPSHYQMTFRALRREGINRATAKQIAHYASVYSDHPKVGRTTENQAIGIATGFSDPKALKYNDKYEPLYP